MLMLGTGFNFWVSQSSSRMCRCVGSRSVLGQQRCAGGKAAVRSDTAGRAPTASRAGRRLTPLGRGAPTAGDAAAQERPAPHVGDSQTPRHLFFRVFPKIIPVLFTSTQGPNRRAQVSDRLHLTGRRLRPGQARPGAVFYGLVLPRWRLLCFRHTRSGRAIHHSPFCGSPHHSHDGTETRPAGGGARRRSGRSALPRWRRARSLSPPKMAGRGRARPEGAGRAPTVLRAARAGPTVCGRLTAQRSARLTAQCPRRRPRSRGKMAAEADSWGRWRPSGRAGLGLRAARSSPALLSPRRRRYLRGGGAGGEALGAGGSGRRPLGRRGRGGRREGARGRGSSARVGPPSLRSRPAGSGAAPTGSPQSFGAEPG